MTPIVSIVRILLPLPFFKGGRELPPPEVVKSEKIEKWGGSMAQG